MADIRRKHPILFTNITLKRKYVLSMYFQGVFHSYSPSYLTETVVATANISSCSRLLSASSQCYQLLLSRLKKGERTFSFRRPCCLESLPDSIHHTVINKFKRNLKTFQLNIIVSSVCCWPRHGVSGLQEMQDKHELSISMVMHFLVNLFRKQLYVFVNYLHGM